MRIMSVHKTVEFSAAHHLPFHRGKCQYPHGHNYKVEVALEGTPDENGILKDFYDIKQDLDDVVLVYDHQDLNNYFHPDHEGRFVDNNAWPTAEVLASVFLNNLRRLDPRYCAVKVWETDDCYAVASEYTFRG